MNALVNSDFERVKEELTRFIDDHCLNTPTLYAQEIITLELQWLKDHLMIEDYEVTVTKDVIDVALKPIQAVKLKIKQLPDTGYFYAPYIPMSVHVPTPQPQPDVPLPDAPPGWYYPNQKISKMPAELAKTLGY